MWAVYLIIHMVELNDPPSQIEKHKLESTYIVARKRLKQSERKFV